MAAEILTGLALRLGHMDRLEKLLVVLRRFTTERDWARFHDPKNLAMLLASEVGELLALLRWVDGPASDAWVRASGNRGRFEAEVADVAIALFLLCDRAGLDLPTAVLSKVEVNRANYPVELSRGRSARPTQSEE